MGFHFHLNLVHYGQLHQHNNQINLRSFSSAPDFGVVAATDFNGMAIFSCPFLLEVRCRTPLPIIVTSQSFAKPNPTVQRMTSNYKNWLAWASDNLLFIILILILVLDSSSWCTYGGFRTWGGEQGGLKSPRSRPKVLSPDNLAIFVAQLVGENIIHTSPSTSSTWREKHSSSTLSPSTS